MSSIVSKKFDAVQANSIWEEAIKRENRLTKLGDTFQITDAKKCECAVAFFQHLGGLERT